MFYDELTREQVVSDAFGTRHLLAIGFRMLEGGEDAITAPLYGSYEITPHIERTAVERMDRRDARRRRNGRSRP